MSSKAVWKVLNPDVPPTLNPKALTLNPKPKTLFGDTFVQCSWPAFWNLQYGGICCEQPARAMPEARALKPSALNFDGKNSDH